MRLRIGRLPRRCITGGCTQRQRSLRLALCCECEEYPFKEQQLISPSRSFGYDSAFVGTTIARSSFKKSFGITAKNSNLISSNITSAFQAGAFWGAFFCFFRKQPQTLTTVLIIVTRLQLLNGLVESGRFRSMSSPSSSAQS